MKPKWQIGFGSWDTFETAKHTPGDQVEQMSSSPRIIIIGIDGGTFEIIDPLVEGGQMPNLAALMRNGVRGQLRSTIPPLTPVAWSAMMTGCNAGKYGTYAFLQISPANYHVRFLNGGDLAAPTLWQIASEAGLRVGVHNMPWTYPPAPVNGYVLAGLDAPVFDSRIAFPKGLFEEVVTATGPYFDKLVPPLQRPYDVGRLRRQVEQTGAVSRHLLQNRPVDIFATVFSSSDHVQHNFWHSRCQGAGDEAVEDVIAYTYQLIDAQIGRILEDHAGPDTLVMVVSDHGAGPCKGGFNIDAWLTEHGYLSRARAPGHARLLSALRRSMPRWLKDQLRGRSRAIKGHWIDAEFARRVNWPQTTAYCWSDYGNLTINLTGRQAQGKIAPGDEYEAVCRRLAQELLDVVHPETDENVVEQVLRAEDLYAGPYFPSAPDLVVNTNDFQYEILTDIRAAGPRDAADKRGIFPPPQRQGLHRLEGILVAAGPGLKSSAAIENANILAIAPTVLYACGLPRPTYMDGQVLTDLFTAEHLQAHPPTDVDKDLPPSGEAADYTAEEAAQVEEHLKSLGYV